MTIIKLWFAFLQIGLFSIGGGYATIPLIQEQVVNTYHWLSLQEFTDIITISQMTPGPLAVNTSTFVGIRIAGIPGAIVATLGCILSGFFISILLYHTFQRYHNAPEATVLLQGLKSASVGLIAASAASLLLMCLFGATSMQGITEKLQIVPLVLCVGSFLILRKWKINPILIMILTGCLGLLFYR